MGGLPYPWAYKGLHLLTHNAGYEVLTREVL